MSRDHQAEYNRRISTPAGRLRLAQHRRNQGARNATRARDRYAEHRHDLVVFIGHRDTIYVACERCEFRSTLAEGVSVTSLAMIQADHRRDV